MLVAAILLAVLAVVVVLAFVLVARREDVAADVDRFYKAAQLTGEWSRLHESTSPYDVPDEGEDRTGLPPHQRRRV